MGSVEPRLLAGRFWRENHFPSFCELYLRLDCHPKVGVGTFFLNTQNPLSLYSDKIQWIVGCDIMEVSLIERLANVLVLIITPLLLIFTEELSIGSVLLVDTLITPPMKILVGIAILCAGGCLAQDVTNMVNIISRLFNVLMFVLPLLFWYIFDENNVTTHPTLQRIRALSIAQFRSIPNNRPFIRWYLLFSGYTTWGVILAIAISPLYGRSVLTGGAIMVVWGLSLSTLSMLGILQRIRERIIGGG